MNPELQNRMTLEELMAELRKRCVEVEEVLALEDGKDEEEDVFVERILNQGPQPSERRGAHNRKN